MIVKLFKSGRSFKALGAYLLHDAGKAATDERLAWTHTLNLANDHPGAAIDEMLWTTRAAEDLKRAAGVKAGGRSLEHPVKHFSLNWHPSENPSREHMIETVEAFLAHMGWQDHQAILFRHDDKRHAHVHVMLNAVHPETGCALDSSYEKRRAQAWAKDYEREHGLIFCEERLRPVEERTKSPHRGTWEKLRASELRHDKAEYERLVGDFDPVHSREHEPSDREAWKELKAHQRREREAFFMDGKQAYRDARDGVFHEVREVFRERWRGYYAAVKDGGDPQQLAEMKAAILEDQGAVLDARRHEAMTALREQRDGDYAALLLEQKERRAELTTCLAAGLSPRQLLDQLEPSLEVTGPRDYHGFAAAAGEVVGSEGRARRGDDRESFSALPEPGQDHAPPAGPKVRTGLDAASGLGLGVLGAIATVGERLFDGFFGGGAKPAPGKPRPVEPTEETDRRAAACTTAGQGKTVARASEAEALAAYWAERRERQRERD